MAGPQERTQQLLDEQVRQKDPFEKLSQARELAAGQLPAEQVLSETTERNIDPANADGNLVEGRSRVLSESDSPTLKQFLTEGDPKAEAAFASSGLPSELGKLGLGNLAEGLAFNEFGKLQLMLRLQEKFGQRFFEVPEARGAITAFEAALNANKTEAKENFAKMMSTGDRTLEILLGGK